MAVGGTLQGEDAGNYVLRGYNDITTADIHRRTISGTITADSKNFDGLTSATTKGDLSGVLEGDSVRLVTDGSFDSPQAGTGRTVNVSGTLEGADAGNYQLALTSTKITADITRGTETPGTGTPGTGTSGTGTSGTGTPGNGTPAGPGMSAGSATAVPAEILVTVENTVHEIEAQAINALPAGAGCFNDAYVLPARAANGQESGSALEIYAEVGGAPSVNSCACVQPRICRASSHQD